MFVVSCLLFVVCCWSLVVGRLLLLLLLLSLSCRCSCCWFWNVRCSLQRGCSYPISLPAGKNGKHPPWQHSVFAWQWLCENVFTEAGKSVGKKLQGLVEWLFSRLVNPCKNAGWESIFSFCNWIHQTYFFKFFVVYISNLEQPTFWCQFEFLQVVLCEKSTGMFEGQMNAPISSCRTDFNQWSSNIGLVEFVVIPGIQSLRKSGEEKEGTEESGEYCLEIPSV